MMTLFFPQVWRLQKMDSKSLRLGLTPSTPKPSSVECTQLPWPGPMSIHKNPFASAAGAAPLSRGVTNALEEESRFGNRCGIWAKG